MNQIKIEQNLKLDKMVEITSGMHQHPLGPNYDLIEESEVDPDAPQHA